MDQRDFRDRWKNFRQSPYDWTLIVGLLALVPLLWLHGAVNLWHRPHLQFFPLAWAGYAALVYTRGSIATTRFASRFWTGVGLGILALLLTFGAVFTFSPWLAHVALWSLCLAWTLVRCGGNPWYSPLAWSTLIIVCLPLPMNLDVDLVRRLQYLSTTSASALLDLTAAPHLALGNVLEIRNGKLFVDEACSGVDSFYALLATALMLAIWRQLGFVVSFLTIVSVPMWAWLGNVVRIFVIAQGLDKFGIDLSHGWQHTLLGLTIFVGAFSCLSITRNAIEAMFSPFAVRGFTAGPIHTFFNRVCAWPGKSRSSKDSQSKSVTKEVNQIGSEPLPSWQLAAGRYRYAVNLAICGFAVLGLMSVVAVFQAGILTDSSKTITGYTEEAVEEFFVASTLPTELHGMQQNAFEVTHRDFSDIFGAHSATWRYTKGRLPVQISLDFPFQGFHPLEGCYQVSGSTLIEPVSHITETSGGGKRIIVEARLADELLDESYLCYAEFNSNGEFSSWFDKSSATGIFAKTDLTQVFQVQIYVANSGELKQKEREEYQEILLEVCRILQKPVRSLVESRVSLRESN